jgi:hypothetical protein
MHNIGAGGRGKAEGSPTEPNNIAPALVVTIILRMGLNAIILLHQSTELSLAGLNLRSATDK